MHHRAATCALAALAVLPLLACHTSPDSLVGVVCTDESRAGIVVTVLDSVTGAAVASAATIVAHSATATDSVQVPGTWDGAYPIARESPGTWTVTVRKAAYRTWTKGGIVVTHDQCHVRTVNVTASLQR